jgi:hypothetical protein
MADFGACSSESAEADDATCQLQQALVEVGAAFAADPQSFELMETYTSERRSTSAEVVPVWASQPEVGAMGN